MSCQQKPNPSRETVPLNTVVYVLQAANNNVSAPVSSSVKIDMHCKWWTNIWTTNLILCTVLTNKKQRRKTSDTDLFARVVLVKIDMHCKWWTNTYLYHQHYLCSVLTNKNSAGKQVILCNLFARVVLVHSKYWTGLDRYVVYRKRYTTLVWYFLHRLVSFRRQIFLYAIILFKTAESWIIGSIEGKISRN